MFGWITSIPKAIGIVGRVKRAIKEGKDVKAAYDKLEAKYADLDDDAKAAWREVREFVQAVADIV